MSSIPLILTIVLGSINILSVVFAVYLYFRNPQIKTDQETLLIQEEIRNIKKEVFEVKETHLRAVEQDIKNLTTSVNELSKTVVKLATIIDERIPKVAQNIT